MALSPNEAMVLVAAVLTTLLETGGSPASTIYLACGMEMRKWEALRDIMLRMDVIKISNHYVTLTEKGTQLATEINSKIPKK